jgi:hypothetical protein
LAGALLFDEKIRKSTALFWFGLRDVGILQIFYSRDVIQRIIVDYPAFLDTVWRKRLRFVPNPSAEEVGELEVHLHEAAQNIELFSNIKEQN